jgi:hypothetical protein
MGRDAALRGRISPRAIVDENIVLEDWPRTIPKQIENA